jgi:hypothetical protein
MLKLLELGSVLYQSGPWNLDPEWINRIRDKSESTRRVDIDFILFTFSSIFDGINSLCKQLLTNLLFYASGHFHGINTKFASWLI